MRVSVFRKAHFNAAHRLHNPTWDIDTNKAVFGPCNNPNFHGHNYEIEVKVTGEVDPETGFVINLDELKKFIKTQVEDHLDHKNLNLEVEEFKNLNPTAENIVKVVWDRLRACLDIKYDLLVRLYETPRNYVEYPG
jgi:6-pyruvoyltetrahydropterin/6-carboxytetrahydropterin synthase